MRNPDGMHNRPVIGINGEWPIPAINITKGDRVVVNVNNQVPRILCLFSDTLTDDFMCACSSGTKALVFTFTAYFRMARTRWTGLWA